LTRPNTSCGTGARMHGCTAARQHLLLHLKRNERRGRRTGDNADTESGRRTETEKKSCSHNIILGTKQHFFSHLLGKTIKCVSACLECQFVNLFFVAFIINDRHSVTLNRTACLQSSKRETIIKLFICKEFGLCIDVCLLRVLHLCHFIA
jgi:hypothetical protein